MTRHPRAGLGLLNLPNELLDFIASALRVSEDINALCRTHSYLYGLLNPVLYRRNVPFALVDGVITGNMATIDRAIKLFDDDSDDGVSSREGQGRVKKDDKQHILHKAYPSEHLSFSTSRLRQHRPCPARPRDDGNQERAEACLSDHLDRGLGPYSALAFAALYDKRESVKVILERVLQRHQKQCLFCRGPSSSINISGGGSGCTRKDSPYMAWYVRSSAALHIASHLGHADVVELLLGLTGHGTEKGKAALHIGGDARCGGGRGELDRYDGQRSPLGFAVEGGRLDVVDQLLRSGCLLTSQSDDNLGQDEDDQKERLVPEAEKGLLSVLATTSLGFFETLVQKMISHGSDIHRWQARSLAWHYSCEHIIQKMQFLLDAGLSASALPPTALHLAAAAGDASLVRQMLDLGVSSAGQVVLSGWLSSYRGDPGYMTPMHCTSLAAKIQCEGRVAEIMTMLLEHHKGPESGSGSGNDSAVVSLEARNRARYHAGDIGMTVLLFHVHRTWHQRSRDKFLAGMVGDCTTTLGLLLAAGADTTATCGRGRDALWHAADRGCYGCIRTLFASVGYDRATASKRLYDSLEGGKVWRKGPLGNAWRDEFEGGIVVLPLSDDGRE